jgi:hypothetical protein
MSSIVYEPRDEEEWTCPVYLELSLSNGRGNFGYPPDATKWSTWEKADDDVKDMLGNLKPGVYHLSATSLPTSHKGGEYMPTVCIFTVFEDGTNNYYDALFNNDI